MGELIRLSGVVSAMNEADHTYSIWNTWYFQQLVTNVPFVACVSNSLSTFTCYLDLSNSILESVLDYRILKF